MTSGVLLNVGCGHRFHRDWVNLDLQPASPQVRACDITRALPLEAGACAAVYHSHVLEHIPRDAAPAFLRECHRVLRPGGVIRVVVPDLEQICRAYLSTIEGAESGDANMLARHRWMTIELLDQLARQRSGGEMIRILRGLGDPLRTFVAARVGMAVVEAAPGVDARRHAARRFRQRIRELVRTWPVLNTYLAGRFRRSGEVHQWMYDRISLADLLRESGFEAPQRTTHDRSAIAGWLSFGLDTDSCGKAIKPDSLYMEARKPS